MAWFKIPVVKLCWTVQVICSFCSYYRNFPKHSDSLTKHPIVALKFKQIAEILLGNLSLSKFTSLMANEEPDQSVPRDAV